MHPTLEPCLEPGMLCASCFARACSTSSVVNSNLYFEVKQLQGPSRYAFAKWRNSGGEQSSWNASFILVWTQPPPRHEMCMATLLPNTQVRLRVCIAIRLTFRFVGIVCVTSGPVSCAVDWVYPQLNVRQLGLSTIKCATLRVRSCLLYTSPSPRDRQKSRMPSSA